MKTMKTWNDDLVEFVTEIKPLFQYINKLEIKALHEIRARVLCVDLKGKLLSEGKKENLIETQNFYDNLCKNCKIKVGIIPNSFKDAFVSAIFYTEE